MIEDFEIGKVPLFLLGMLEKHMTEKKVFHV